MVYFSFRYGETNRRREDNLLFTVLKRSGHAVPQRTTQCDTEVGGRNTWVQKTAKEPCLWFLREKKWAEKPKQTKLA